MVKNNNPLTLSIVIPVYNEEDYLAGCLDAISRQTEAPDEVIVVENNCTDDTVAVANRFPFVRIIHETEQGLYFARNTGMNAVKSDIIARIDADTQLDSDWVRQVKKVFAHPSVGIVTGPLGYHDEPFPKITRWIESVLLRIAVRTGYKFIFGANMAIQKNVWKSVLPKLCNETYLMEDIDMAVHLEKMGIIPVYDPKIRAMVSARRLADSPLDFWRYINGHPRTLAHHSKRSVGAYFAVAAFSAVYLMFKPLYMIFDPRSRRLSFRYLFNNPAPRPDPMDMEKYRPESPESVAAE